MAHDFDGSAKLLKTANFQPEWTQRARAGRAAPRK
jgi:hypothetical protein